MFRGGKSDYWEGGVRVPAFAWWPGTIEPGQVVGDIDEIPTVHELVSRIMNEATHTLSALTPQ